MHRLFSFLTASFFLFALGCLVVACGSNSAEDADDTTSAELAATSSAIGSGATQQGLAYLMAAPYAAALGADCTTMAYGACDTTAKTETRYFSPSAGDASPCTRGVSHGRNVFGASVLTFSAANCGLTPASTMAHTWVNHYVQRGNHG